MIGYISRVSCLVFAFSDLQLTLLSMQEMILNELKYMCTYSVIISASVVILESVLEETEADEELLHEFRTSLLSRLVKRSGDKYTVSFYAFVSYFLCITYSSIIYQIVMELFNSIDVHLSGYLNRVEFKLLLTKLRLRYR